MADPPPFDAAPSCRTVGTSASAASPSAPRVDRHRDGVAARLPLLHALGLPEKFHRAQPEADRRDQRAPGLAGSDRGHRASRRSLDEFDQVQDGEILVCQMTNPAWVVLFTKIGGLVTDAGGVASHPAVVSREFGIPAVVGTSNATSGSGPVTRPGQRLDGRRRALRDNLVHIGVCFLTVRAPLPRLPGLGGGGARGRPRADGRCQRRPRSASRSRRSCSSGS